MSKKSWTSVYTTNEDTQALKTVPPPLPYKPCRDPERRDSYGNVIHKGHGILTGGWQWEFRARICIWCDQEHATGWGRIVDEWLTEEQLALVQELRREEEEKKEHYG